MAKSAPKLDPRGRKVKILATVGPASRSPEMLARLFKAGVDAFRVNMSHGEHADHAQTIETIDLLTWYHCLCEPTWLLLAHPSYNAL